MKPLLMITLLLLGVSVMSTDTIVAKASIEEGFGIKLGEVMTPERLSKLESTGIKTQKGQIRVFPFGKKNVRNVYFIATNAKGEVFEIFATTMHDPDAFGNQHYKSFCLRYGKVPDERMVSWSDPQNSKRTLALIRDGSLTQIWYYDAVLSDRVKTQ